MACFKGGFILLHIIVNHFYATANSDNSVVDDNELSVDESTTEIDNCIVVKDGIHDKVDLSTSLKALNLKKIGNEVHLSWEISNTNSESNFIIEKSITGKNYKSITEIECDDLTNTPTQYGFVDPNLKAGETIFYRLRYKISNEKSKVYNFIPMKIKVAKNLVEVGS